MTKGERIKKKRTALDMTLEEVAKIVKVSKQTIQRYETGVINTIPSDKIELLALALKTTPTYIMGWEDDGEDERIANLNTADLTKLDKILNETALFFNDEKVSEEDKEALHREIIEMYFIARDKKKKEKK